VLESIDAMLAKLPLETSEWYGDPRHYNVRWMSLLEELHAEQRGYATIY
jgi:hypothetical protein